MSSSGGDAGRVVIAEGQPVVAGALVVAAPRARLRGHRRRQLRASCSPNLERFVPDVIVVDGDVVQSDAEMLARLRGDPRYHDVRVIVAVARRIETLRHFRGAPTTS